MTTLPQWKPHCVSKPQLAWCCSPGCSICRKDVVCCSTGLSGACCPAALLSCCRAHLYACFMQRCLDLVQRTRRYVGLMHKHLHTHNSTRIGLSQRACQHVMRWTCASLQVTVLTERLLVEFNTDAIYKNLGRELRQGVLVGAAHATKAVQIRVITVARPWICVPHTFSTALQAAG